MRWSGPPWRARGPPARRATCSCSSGWPGRSSRGAPSHSRRRSVRWPRASATSGLGSPPPVTARAPGPAVTASPAAAPALTRLRPRRRGRPRRLPEGAPAGGTTRAAAPAARRGSPRRLPRRSARRRARPDPPRRPPGMWKRSTTRPDGRRLEAGRADPPGAASAPGPRETRRTSGEADGLEAVAGAARGAACPASDARAGRSPSKPEAEEVARPIAAAPESRAPVAADRRPGHPRPAPAGGGAEQEGAAAGGGPPVPAAPDLRGPPAALDPARAPAGRAGRGGRARCGWRAM